jgi:O-antigen/teichoic acid export membrane protein
VTASRIDPVPAPTTTAGSLKERFVRGFGWNAVATASTQGSTLVVNVMLANLWSLQVFGEYSMVQSTLAALVAVAQPSTGTAATKYAAELRHRDPERAGRILGLCGLVSLAIAAVVLTALVGTADLVAARMLERPQLAAALSIGGAAVFFNVISGFLSGSLSGLERYRALGKAGLMTGTLYVVLTFTGGYLGGVRGAIIGVAVVACFQVLVLATVLARAAAGQGIRIDPRAARRELAVFHGFVAPAALNSLVAYPAIWLGNAFLVKQDQGYAQMALFAAANSFRILVLVVPNILNTVAYSLLNHELGAGHEARYRRLFWTNIGFAAALACAATTSIALLGPWLLQAFGEEFQAAYPVLLILMLAAIPEPMAIALVQVVQSRERVWLSFFGMILPAYGTLAILAWVLTPHGAIGLAWSYAAAMGIALVCSATAVGRIGLWPSEKTRA